MLYNQSMFELVSTPECFSPSRSVAFPLVALGAPQQGLKARGGAEAAELLVTVLKCPEIRRTQREHLGEITAVF